MKYLIMDVFNEVRRELYFPPIKLRLVEGYKIRLNFSGKYRKPEVVVGKEVFLYHSRIALKGLFKLSLARWIWHPYSLKTSLMEDFWLRNFEKKKRIKELFDTIICSIYLLKKGHLEVLDALKETCKDRADIAVKAFIERKFKLSDTKYEEDIESIVEKMKEINFERSNLKDIKINILKFAKIINSLIEYKEEIFELKITSMDRALEEVAGEVGINEFREISNYFGIGKGKGKSKLADVYWYLKRSAKYSLKVEESVFSGDYPGTIVDLSLDDGIDFFAPVESMGKILPSIAKKYKPEGFEGIGKSRKNALIIIDSSGSMEDPEKGSNAIICAFAIARKYIESGGRIGVINFSGETKLLKPEKGEEVYKALAEYQGGGTEINVKKVLEYAKTYAKGFDVILITDAGIDNLSEVKFMLRELKGLGCKNYIVWIASKTFENYVSSLSEYARVFRVSCERDISKINIR